MTEPSVIAREAKALHAGLKEFLKTRDPWEKEVEFQRQDLRRRHLSLLLLHPYAPEARDVETHLWMQTSYSFITVYKQRIASIDRAIQHGSRPNPNNHRGHGPVEHRKLTQRFRQFLAEEDKFWAQFAARFRRAFSLREANHAFLELQLATEDELEGQTDMEAVPSRHHFQFPEPTQSNEPMTSQQRQSRLSILSKALICMGDIARYREQYNESGGRPRAGHEEHELLAPLKRERGGRRGRNKEPNLERRPRNYDRAQSCYEHARRLVPDDGNPSHQMAIIASYQNDVFSSVVHYYRALCVRQPYEPAADNLSTVFHKALDQFKRRKQQEHEKGDASEVSVRSRIDSFKDKIVVIHALWRHGSDRALDSLLRKLTSSACTDFQALISQRHLPHDVIEEVMILAQAALWKHYMVREKSAGSETTEYRIFAHLLLMHRTLLEVGIDELKDAAASNVVVEDLAQRITGEFRRTLPALRISSKWLRANYKHVMKKWDAQCVVDVRKMGRGARERDKDSKKGSTMLVKFWQRYADFSRVLARAFPSNQLPTLTVPLEEDVDMRGFLPLKKQLDVQGVGAFEDQAAQEHPNVLQLMRIWDLLEDAKALARLEDSPIAMYGKQFVLKGVEAQVTDDLGSSDIGSGGPNHTRSSIEEVEDDLPEGVSTNDDEAIRHAFDHLDTKDDWMQVDDEEQIVWDPRVSETLVTRERGPSISNIPSTEEDPVVPSMPAKAVVAPIGSPLAPLKPISPAKETTPLDKTFSPFTDGSSTIPNVKGPLAKKSISSLQTSPTRVPGLSPLNAAPSPALVGSPSTLGIGPLEQGLPSPSAKDSSHLKTGHAISSTQARRVSQPASRGMSQSPSVGTTAQDLVKSMMAPRRSALDTPGPLGTSTGLGGGFPPGARFAPQWGVPVEEQSSLFNNPVGGGVRHVSDPSLSLSQQPISLSPPTMSGHHASMFGQQQNMPSAYLRPAGHEMPSTGPSMLSQPPLSQQTAWSSQGSQGLGAMLSAPFAPQPMGGGMQAPLPPARQVNPYGDMVSSAPFAGYGDVGYGGQVLDMEMPYNPIPSHAGHIPLDPRYGSSATWGNVG
ncbi:hypothetical protein BD626DRAFT_566125 [Schizophyllum amplum]|uniref:Est1 DNA/RNA binding domain-containing protein n=1 Tax=Schizophyllum amplum TaxID=97359 RepID=A0A550CQN5_9AGAR|nr:hypothetical protein BD626DRAFT_566125 [Auriculariopsis ampla]